MAVTQKFFWSLIVVVVRLQWIIVRAQDVSLRSLNMLNTDVTSGREVCPGLSLMFKCKGIDLSFLEFQINGMEIEPNFNIGDVPGERNSSSGPYTLELVSIDVDQARRVANMTVRLITSISSLMSTDKITCATLGRNSSIMLNYTLRGTPPAPVIGTDFSISPEEDDNSTFKFMISWNSSSAFTSTNAITSYIVTPLTTTIEGRNVAINCPPSCSLDAPCQCSTGLRLGERIFINISAINCGTQQGEAVEVTVASSCPSIDLGTVENTTDSSCARRVTIPNGVGCFKNLTVNSMVSYMCNEGYSAGGNDLMRTCLINGSWNGSVPKCILLGEGSAKLNVFVIVIPIVVILILIVMVVAITIVLVIWKFRFRDRKEDYHVCEDQPDSPERVSVANLIQTYASLKHEHVDRGEIEPEDRHCGVSVGEEEQEYFNMVPKDNALGGGIPQNGNGLESADVHVDQPDNNSKQVGNDSSAAKSDNESSNNIGGGRALTLEGYTDDA